MLLNGDTVVVGSRVLLIPYKSIHVEKYHSWMKSEEILKLTASEPLTLDQEYSMQKSWHHDDDKVTFIIADRTRWSSFCCDTDAGTKTYHPVNEEYSEENPTQHESRGKCPTAAEMDSREVSCIVGDVNLFFHDPANRGKAEIEIMVAEAEARNRGMATEALSLMMAYGCFVLNVRSYEAKIGCANTPSINLFTKKLGFSEISKSEIFQEITLNHVIDIGDDSTVDKYVSENFGVQNFHAKMQKYSEFRLASHSN